jgi:hypothetical protein
MFNKTHLNVNELHYGSNFPVDNRFFNMHTTAYLWQKLYYKRPVFTFFLLFTNNYNHKIDKFTALMAFILKLSFTTIKKSVKIVKNSTEAASR